MTPRIFRSTITKAEGGSFLLEALIAVLIVALGIMGLIGLQARAIQSADDSQYRSEAAFLANDLLGRMWTSNFAPTPPGCVSTVTNPCIADFDKGSGAAAYTDFRAWVFARLPGASAIAGFPNVTVTPRFADPTMGYDVLIDIRWHPPGDPAGYPDRRYTTAATVKLN